ncbi:hypothetical protein PP175_03810 [Aneurinibacillus sp. Ricciae_BoGa-3]|uniref:hypothetical protein n=1 Tax=Aneurinibacillus sp. Ricciae_BoGa-3 TaxID=3022697 RepID=UPI00233FA53C|nr:hypothetical protein [Aneurinibacillus sp. Ricciae_BoGa-3]WCK55123.1 hypothetical protein PP175_03810 [Aneurinibacillus sp. Ricciae_BoGa-3]
MNSKQKMSQIKRFAKGKIHEFIRVLPEHLKGNIDFSMATIHLQNYSYDSYGSNLISMKLAEHADIGDYDQFKCQLDYISYENKLGLYVSVDEESREIQFFNKALNNHIKTYQLMVHDEKRKIYSIIDQVKKAEDRRIQKHIPSIRQLLSLSKDIYLILFNVLKDDKDCGLDTIEMEGILEKVTEDTIALDNANFAEVKSTLKISDGWEIEDIQLWASTENDVELELL